MSEPAAFRIDDYRRPAPPPSAEPKITVKADKRYRFIEAEVVAPPGFYRLDQREAGVKLLEQLMFQIAEKIVEIQLPPGTITNIRIAHKTPEPGVPGA